MKLCVLVPITGFALALSACATKPAYCVDEPVPVHISPAHPTAPGVRLVSIAKSGRVTLRDESGELVSARPGEEFLLRDGLSAGYRLKSVDRVSGDVTLEAHQYVMHSQR